MKLKVLEQNTQFRTIIAQKKRRVTSFLMNQEQNLTLLPEYRVDAHIRLSGRGIRGITLDVRLATASDCRHRLIYNPHFFLALRTGIVDTRPSLV